MPHCTNNTFAINLKLCLQWLFKMREIGRQLSEWIRPQSLCCLRWRFCFWICPEDLSQGRFKLGRGQNIWLTGLNDYSNVTDWAAAEADGFGEPPHRRKNLWLSSYSRFHSLELASTDINPILVHCCKKRVVQLPAGLEFEGQTSSKPIFQSNPDSCIMGVVKNMS